MGPNKDTYMSKVIGQPRDIVLRGREKVRGHPDRWGRVLGEKQVMGVHFSELERLKVNPVIRSPQSDRQVILCQVGQDVGLTTILLFSHVAL